MRVEPNSQGGMDYHFGGPGQRPGLETDLERIAFEENGLKTILYKVNDYVEKKRDGVTVYLCLPLVDWDKGSILETLPDSGRSVVIMHPDNYLRFSDLCAKLKLTIQEWKPL